MKIYIKTFFIALLATSFSFLISFYDFIFDADSNIMETFFNVFGTLYAIMVGFVILMVSNYYHQIKNAINDEINSIQDLHDYLVYVDNNDQVVLEIKQAINDYISSIIEQEWPKMRSSEHTEVFTSEPLYNIMKKINKLEPKNPSDIAALEKLMSEVNAITTYRTDRLGMSNENLPPLLVHVSFILSVSVVFVFLFMPIDSFFLKIILNGILSFAVGLIYYMIIDLNNPFRGDWRVTFDSYQKLLEKLKKY